MNGVKSGVNKNVKDIRLRLRYFRRQKPRDWGFCRLNSEHIQVNVPKVGYGCGGLSGVVSCLLARGNAT